MPRGEFENSQLRPSSSPETPCPICAELAGVSCWGEQHGPILRCSACTGMFRPVWRTDDAGNRMVQHQAFGARYVRSRQSIARWLRLEARRTLRRLRRYVPPPARMLEFGCATGELCSVAAKAGYEAFGMEMSPEARAYAAEVNGVRVLGGEFVDAASASAFDAIVGVHTFEHFRDPHQALRQIRDLLVPGGVLYLEVPSAQSWAVRARGPRCGVFTAEHLFFHTRRSLERLLSEHGFHVVACTTVEGYSGIANFVLDRIGVLSAAAWLARRARGQQRYAQRDASSHAGKADAGERTIDAGRAALTAFASSLGFVLGPVRWFLGSVGLGGNLVVVARRRGTGSHG